MSSRESIKVKRLSPTPEELRKSMKENSKEVAMWKFKLEWKESIKLTKTRTKYFSQYSDLNIYLVIDSSINHFEMIIMNNETLQKVAKVNFVIPTPSFKENIHMDIAENIVRSIVCGIQGIAEDKPIHPDDYIEMAEKRKKVFEKESCDEIL